MIVHWLHLPSVPFSVRGGPGFSARCVVNMRKMWRLQLVVVLCYFLWIRRNAAPAITDPQKGPHRDILFLLLANYNWQHHHFSQSTVLPRAEAVLLSLKMSTAVI